MANKIPYVVRKGQCRERCRILRDFWNIGVKLVWGGVKFGGICCFMALLMVECGLDKTKKCMVSAIETTNPYKRINNQWVIYSGGGKID